MRNSTGSHFGEMQFLVLGPNYANHYYGKAYFGLYDPTVVHCDWATDDLC
ncbi:MAG: hypothetical protein U0556_01355 [Dehalococcoidia bacterium]